MGLEIRHHETKIWLVPLVWLAHLNHLTWVRNQSTVRHIRCACLRRGPERSLRNTRCWKSETCSSLCIKKNQNEVVDLISLFGNWLECWHGASWPPPHIVDWVCPWCPWCGRKPVDGHVRVRHFASRTRLSQKTCKATWVRQPEGCSRLDCLTIAHVSLLPRCGVTQDKCMI